MKTFAIVVAAALVRASLAGETQLSVKGPDGLTGTAKLSTKLLEDGSRYVSLSLRLSYNGNLETDVLEESTYDSKGRPVRMLQTTHASGKKTSTSVNFTEEGAQVVTNKSGTMKTNLVVFPEGTTANPTVFWFCRDKPEKGRSVEYYLFRLSESSWSKAKSRYDGDEDIVVSGRKVTAHVVRIGEVTSWLDDKGDPYRIELQGLTLERTN
ncbi:MAG: hypothetical protein JNM34_03530 [Chthonomonadaceae bacterium]|nr:hypothetical protein [Chthonomonadaceae bacterium]